MVANTVERSLMAKNLDRVILAIDSEETKKALKNFDFEIVMTSKDHTSGTDRIAEAAKNLNAKQFINLQGDEPIFPVEELKFFIQKAISYPEEISTGVTEIKSEDDCGRKFF